MKEVSDCADSQADEAAGAAPPRAGKRGPGGEPAIASRKEAAEAVRKAAYTGDEKKLDGVLASLSIVDRLLLIDDLDPKEGYSPLHLAVIQGHAPTASSLVRQRADIDLPSRAGDTPLGWAAYLGRQAMCKTLLRLRADASVVVKGRTAADQAKLGGHMRLHELLQARAEDSHILKASSVAAAESMRMSKMSEKEK